MTKKHFRVYVDPVFQKNIYLVRLYNNFKKMEQGRTAWIGLRCLRYAVMKIQVP